MNKYKEAYQNIVKCNCADCTCESMKVLGELVEKAIPKKPKLIKDSFDDFYQCSNCVRILDYKQKYCDECGQAISWSQEEEDV